MTTLSTGALRGTVDDIKVVIHHRHSIRSWTTSRHPARHQGRRRAKLSAADIARPAARGRKFDQNSYRCVGLHGVGVRGDRPLAWLKFASGSRHCSLPRVPPWLLARPLEITARPTSAAPKFLPRRHSDLRQHRVPYEILAKRLRRSVPDNAARSSSSTSASSRRDSRTPWRAGLRRFMNRSYGGTTLLHGSRRKASRSRAMQWNDRTRVVRSSQHIPTRRRHAPDGLRSA